MVRARLEDLIDEVQSWIEDLISTIAEQQELNSFNDLSNNNLDLTVRSREEIDSKNKKIEDLLEDKAALNDLLTQN
ncbi:hypothetical protein pipiens_002008 [Culex pipiens pipiens]|uniref:Uncharacterized protein n=1 Tax=Culex pipiens pipiens TaxID=38569 RepID=A0ABD1DMP5_CULPP